MRKWTKITAFTLVFVLLVCGCAKRDNDGEELTTYIDKTNSEENENQGNLDILKPMAYGNVEGLNLEPGTYISIIGKSSEGSFWKAAEKGAKRAVEDINTMLGYKGEDKVKMTYNAPADPDNVDEQINILDEELARYPAAVGIAVIDSKACEVQFDLAAENGIPVVGFDTGTGYQGIMAQCETNNEEAARTAAVKLASAMNGKGEAAVFVHDTASLTGQQREKGFTEEIKTKYPDISVVNVYHLDELSEMAKQIADEAAGKNSVTEEPAGEGGAVKEEGETQEKAAPIDTKNLKQEDVIRYILEKNPNITGCFTTNADTTQLVLNVLEETKKENVSLVGFDGGDDQIKTLGSEYVEGLIVQNPYGMGYAAVVAAARSILDMGNQALVDTGYTWVTKDNMDKKVIKRMLY